MFPFPQICEAHIDGFHSTPLLIIQSSFGGAWVLGCCIFGILVRSSKKRKMSKQYLCQISLVLAGCSSIAFTIIPDYIGYMCYVWTYGIFSGGYSYCLKMLIYEKVRARNFARAWGFAQFFMGITTMMGMTISGILILELFIVIVFFGIVQ